MSVAEDAATQSTIQLFKDYVVPNYVRYPVELVRGEGSYVWDRAGDRYLDFFPGWGCNILGHCPTKVVQAVQEQVATLIHVPNTWYTEVQGRWAKLLSERSFGGQAFFCNSGAEANEAAIKLARLHTPPDKYKIVTFQGGFHGRTLGATAATAQPKYHQGLGPLMAGFNYAPFGDLEAAKKLVDDETCGILVEPIQGEGGIKIPPQEFLQGLRDLATERGCLLMFDEVQAGFGRTGEWFAYQHFGVVPDVMTLAKGLCAGIAGAALLTTKEIAPSLRPGMHAATLGGNPIAAAAGIAAIETIDEQNLLPQAVRIGDLFKERMEDLKKRCSLIKDVRGQGVMIGIELFSDGVPVVQACLEKKLLINCTQGTVIRLLPAMTLEDEQVHAGCDILEHVLLERSK
jgi:predicted acetylornithine/succinylornithine family transaminase